MGKIKKWDLGLFAEIAAQAISRVDIPEEIRKGKEDLQQHPIWSEKLQCNRAQDNAIPSSSGLNFHLRICLAPWSFEEVALDDQLTEKRIRCLGSFFPMIVAPEVLCSKFVELIRDLPAKYQDHRPDLVIALDCEEGSGGEEIYIYLTTTTTTTTKNSMVALLYLHRHLIRSATLPRFSCIGY